MVFLYNIALQFYLLIIKLIQPFNEKASLWLEGRLTVWNDLDIHLTANKKPVIWVHCSSLGEFEQGRPIIEALNKHFPQYQVLLSFFSPSGYEATKHFNKADHIFYLPIDTAKNAERLIKKLKPVCVFFIKYDYWYHYLHQAKKQAIPVVLVSGIFRKNQPFFQWYGGLHKKMLACFSNFYVQNNESKELLASIGFNNNVWVTGDTRFDRVVEIAGNFEPIPPIEMVVKQKKVFVAGSTWLHDDALIAKFCKLHPQFIYIIAPHDVSNKRIQECLNIYPNACLWTDIEKGGQANNVIIINTIGLLSKLYYYAHICYVGGGFGSDGVHNVAEAAIYHKPIVFGPEYAKYREAVDLINCKGAFSVGSAYELTQTLQYLFNHPAALIEAGNLAGNYIIDNAGATQKILSHIHKNRLLTNV